MNTLARFALFATTLVAVGLGVAHLRADGSAEVAFDPGRTFQTMTGWEGTADLPDDPTNPSWAGYREALYDSVVNDVGINRVRLEIRSGAESRHGAPTRFLRGEFGYEEWKTERYRAENDNDDPFDADLSGFDFAELDWHVRETVLPLQERLAARGERLIVNLCYVSFRDGPLFHMDPEEYAELVLVTYRHLESGFGFVPDLWEVILEPDLQRNAWTGAKIGAAMAAAAARLRAAGYTPAFVAPSVTDMANAVPFASAIRSVEGAREAWSELSYHRYRNASARSLGEIASFAEAHGLRTAMLEWWFGRATHDVLLEDLDVGGVSAFQGRVVTGFHEAPRVAGDPPPMREDTRFNRLYFTAIREGAVRVAAESSAPGFVSATGFVNRGGRSVVMIRARGAGDVTLSGLPPGDHDVSTVLERGGAQPPAVLSVVPGAPARIEMAGPGLVSVVQR